MDWFLAIVPVLLSIGLVYFSIFQMLRYLFRKHRIWFFAFIILMTPYAFVLVQASNALDVLWMLVLTPFYGVFVMLLVATTTIIRFYCSAFAALAILEFLLQHRKMVNYNRNNDSSNDDLWQKRFALHHPKRQNTSIEITIGNIKSIRKRINQ